MTSTVTKPQSSRLVVKQEMHIMGVQLKNLH